MGINDIACKWWFELILKSSDNSPACVKPKTAMNLIERGWGEKHENKTWIVVPAVAHCLDPWDQDEKTMSLADRITHYYKNHDVEIHDMIPIIDPEIISSCLACDCPSVFQLSVLVDESDVERALNLGLIAAEKYPTNKPIPKNIKPHN